MPPAGASILLVPIMVELQAFLYISTNYKLMLMSERGIWLTLVLSEALTLVVSVLLSRKSVVFNE